MNKMDEFDIEAEARNPGNDDPLSRLLASREAKGEAQIQPGGYNQQAQGEDPLSRLLAFRDATSQPQIQPNSRRSMTPEQLQAILSMLLAPMTGP